jgi:hypothetical protein
MTFALQIQQDFTIHLTKADNVCCLDDCFHSLSFVAVDV